MANSIIHPLSSPQEKCTLCWTRLNFCHSSQYRKVSLQSLWTKKNVHFFLNNKSACKKNNKNMHLYQNDFGFICTILKPQDIGQKFAESRENSRRVRHQTQCKPFERGGKSLIHEFPPISTALQHFSNCFNMIIAYMLHLYISYVISVCYRERLLLEV